MKNRLLFSAALLLVTATTCAGVPQGLNYQAVARGSNGAVIPNQRVGLQFTIHSGSAGGTTIYQESDTATTNEFGIFTTVIGFGAASTGSFDSILWGKSTLFLQVGLDPTGGATYQTMGTTQLVSVPYAIHAGSSGQWSNYRQNDIINNNDSGTVFVNSTNDWGLQVQSTTPYTYEGFSTNGGTFRGYIGTYSDTAGVDFGTGYLNTTGTVNLVIADQPKLTVAPSGNVGIGTTTPAATLDVEGNIKLDSSSANAGYPVITFNNNPSSNNGGLIEANTDYFWMFQTGSTFGSGIYLNRNNNDVEPDFDDETSLGNSTFRWSELYASNGVIQTSDERMKKNIQTLDMGLNTVMQLRPVKYEWKNPKEGDGENIGFIAQEVENVVPQAVVHGKPMTDAEIAAAKKVGKTIPGIKDPYGMKYSEIIPVLTKAIQDQQALIEKMQKEIDELKSRK